LHECISQDIPRETRLIFVLICIAGHLTPDRRSITHDGIERCEGSLADEYRPVNGRLSQFGLRYLAQCGELFFML
jgi:hypothetical protein